MMLRQELGVAPRSSVVVSALIACGLALLWMLIAPRPPLPVRIALGLALGVFIFLYGFLVSYVYGDARRRGMRAGIWALVAACVPHALGFIAYFLLRDPVLRPCGGCGGPARRDFAFCPQCGTGLREVCPGCRRPFEAAYRHCVHCGTRLP
jgi:hypothetical protein